MPPLTNPMTLKRIHREVADLKKEDMGAMTLSPSEDNLFLWKGTIPGPEGSVYEGGIFNLDVVLASDYPFTAPKISFKTRIYHMNISDRGDICIDILKHNWSPALSLFKVMLSLSSLLTDPNPKDPLVSSIANQYLTNRKLHDDIARQWTGLYAKPKVPTKSSAKAQGKAKASLSSSASSSRGNSVSLGAIEIVDSDDEVPAKPRAGATQKAGSKRKRETRASVGGEPEYSDDERESSLPSGSGKTASRASGGRTTAGGSGRRVAPRLSTEVIEIEDD